MKLLKKLITTLLVLAGFFWIKSHQPSFQAVYPEQCWFLIDEKFSSSFQQQIKDFVADKYHVCKNPEQILQDVSTKFTEISSMDAYICKIDKICFTFDGARPLFVLNDQVVDNNFHLINKNYYRNDIVKNLQVITASNTSRLQEMMKFMSGVPVALFEEFDMRWNSDSEIILQAKTKKQEQLMFSMKSIPTLDDIALFKDLQKNIGTKKKKGNVFDFRFNNQVIVK